MLNNEQKIELILMFKKGIINKNQLQSVIAIGFPMPIIMETKEITEHDKNILSLGWIYRLLGQQIIGITFKK